MRRARGSARGWAGALVLGLAACAAPPVADAGPAPALDFERVDAPAEAADGFAPVVAEPAADGGTGPGGTGRGQGERILLHVADAPPHDADARRFLDAASAAARRQVQIVSMAASGTDTPAEMLMRQAAALTQGRYLFLTDDSGVGLSHEEPTVPCYVVTELRDQLVRVLRSEIRGRRVEAAPGAVVREVGSIRGGVCLD